MNKSNVRHKRSLGKDSPLSKRPKLDFTLKTKEPLKDNICNNKDSPKSSNMGIKDKTSLRKNIQEHTPTSSDWDDDFSGDMLEKVCLIADLSQAMVNNQPVPGDCDIDKIDFGIFENKKTTPKAKSLCPPPHPQVSENSYENLRLEFERLQEKLKTKEGEVHILRSQLKQSEDAKQAVALQNIKVLEDIQKKFSEKISLTEKELESTKSKLLFRDLEYRTLSERCRQLECNIAKSKTEANSMRPFSMSQVINQSSFAKEANENEQMAAVDSSKGGVLLEKDFLPEFHHDGKCLAEIICPEFFKFTDETNIISNYNFLSEINSQKASLLYRREKCKWSNLPKQTVYVKDLYDSVSSLFTYEDFVQKEAQRTVKTVLNSCMEILTHLTQVLLCLEKLHLCSDYDKADESLLQNEEEVELVILKKLLSGEKLSKEECGNEGRRSLALICALINSSQFAFKAVKDSPNFIGVIKNLTAAIGSLRRPLRFNGILIGISFILQKILEEENLTEDYLKLINETVEEIIFSRPKLDVLMETVNVLISGTQHLNFLTSLCRNDSVDSCTLYIDCKLKQAMFFTKDTCPLKLLCVQIMGLACLPSSKPLKWKITSNIIMWLNSSINTPHFRKIKWLPINFLFRQERCFDVTECLLFLLTLCVKDYLELCTQESVTLEKADTEKKKVHWISIIAEGSVLLKRILKTDQRPINDNNYSLRFATLLKGVLPSKSDLCQKSHLSSLSSMQVEAINWISDLLESDLKNQDCCLKQSTSAISDVDFFKALKIHDIPKIN